MTTTTTDPTLDERASAYLAQVRDRLADLPADERDDLLDDLEAHIHQVAAATEGPLDDALGSPATFAAELRASAGLAPSAGGRRRPLDGLRQRGDAVRDHPWTRAAVGFLPELRPAWWAARGWLLVWLVAEATGGDESSFPLPEPFGNAFVGLLATVPAVVWSVRLGRGATSPRWHWLVNAFAVLGAILFVDAAGHDDAAVPYVVDGDPWSSSGQYGDPGTLWRSDGSPVTDLDAYGPDGRPTYGVTIVDQDGTPYEVGPDPARPTIPRDFWPNPDGTWGAAEGQQTPTTPLDPSAPDPSTTATTVPAS